MESRTSTESSLADLTGFDTWDDQRILAALLAGQRRALDAVERALPAIAQAAALVTDRIGKSGHLFYAGAGTSIRVGVQDGTELPATFGLSEDKLEYLIAGGKAAMFETMADAEDDVAAGRTAAQACTAADVLIAIAASGRTPYTIAAAEQAQELGCAVITIVNNAGSPLSMLGDVRVTIETGAEVISGSTRLSAGTAQKATLNLISSLAFTRLGAVHDGLMVNVEAGNSKLVARSRGIVMKIAGVDDVAAGDALEETSNDIKSAILICKGARLAEAQRLLSEENGNLRRALATHLSKLQTSV